MTDRPTYKHLTERIRDLEKEVSALNEELSSIKASENNWRTLVENAPGIIIITDREGVVQYINRTISGLSQDDVVGKNVNSFQEAEYRDQTRRVLDRIFEGGKRGTFQLKGIGPDASTAWYEVNYGPLIRDGEVVNATFITTDITERKQVEESLRESEQKYRLLINNYSDPITVYDGDGVTLVINQAAAVNLGGRPEDLINRSVFDYLPDKADTIVKRCRQVIQSGKGAHFEDMFDLLPGKRWFWSNLQPVRDADGCIYAVQIISYDITERKETEEALRKAHDELEERVEQRTAELVKANEKLQNEIEERKRLEKVLMQEEKLKTLGAVAAEVAHEIRNPLVSIGGFAQRLKNKYPDEHECDIILSESNRLEKILSRIRRYLEPVEIHPKECDVNGIIHHCVHLLSPETERRRVKCHLELTPELSTAYADPEIVTQIFINLIRNATQAMQKGGILNIRSFENIQELYIEFKNLAPGLKIEDSEALFMPFSEGGQSLGLPLSYRLLKDMGGMLSFSQNTEFRVFTVSLPKAGRLLPKEKDTEAKSIPENEAGS